MRTLPSLAFAAVLCASFGTLSTAGADDPAPGAPPAAPAPAPRPAERGYLGFSSAPVAAIPEEARKGMGITADKGVVVTSVLFAGPAGEAGLKVGDVIVKYAGHDIPLTSDGGPEALGAAFVGIAETVKVGQEVEIGVTRAGTAMTLKGVAAAKRVIEQASAREKIGPLAVALVPAAILPPPLKARWKIKAEKGIVAAQVVKGGPAATAGIVNGDVVLKYAGKDLPDAKDVDGKKPETFQGVMRALHDIVMDVKTGADVEIVVERDGKPVTLKATAADGPTIAKLADSLDEDGEGDEGDEGPEGPEKK